MLTPPVTHFVNNGLQRVAYSPLRKLVSNVTNAVQAQVTTTTNHNFTDGQSVRLIVPEAYGMAINERGLVTFIDDTNFSITIDTSSSLAFVTPVAVPNTPSAFTDAQAVADSGLWNNTGAV